jgi:hypothetical protein
MSSLIIFHQLERKALVRVLGAQIRLKYEKLLRMLATANSSLRENAWSSIAPFLGDRTTLVQEARSAQQPT